MPTCEVVLVLKKPQVTIRISKAGNSSASDAIMKWPNAIMMMPIMAVLRCPSTLSASQPPSSGVA